MRLSISFFTVILFSFVLISSCSSKEDETTDTIGQTPQPDPVEFTLTVTAGEGGTVSNSGGTYEQGSEISITATPNQGYRFDGWDGIDSIDTTISIVISSDTNI